MENEKIVAAQFEKYSSPFQGEQGDTKKLIASLTGPQLAAAQQFITSLGGKAAGFIRELTPSKAAFLIAILEEQRKARLAIARWNWVAKSIKYSFLSLSLSMLSAFLIAQQLEGTTYDPYELLEGYVGSIWMRRWFLALFVGAMHNVYDSIALQLTIKKIREFTTKYVALLLRKKKKKEEKQAQKSGGP